MTEIMNRLRQGSLLLLVLLCACKSQQAPVSTSGLTRHQQWLEDIEFFETKFVAKAKTYTEETEAACYALLDDLRGNIDDLTDLQIRLELNRCVALADNGHTTAPLPRMDEIPLRLYRFSDGLRVVKADSASAHWLGAEVVAINGYSIPEVEESLAPFLSGEYNWKQYQMLRLFTSPQLLHALGMGDENAITLTLAGEQGTETATLGTKKLDEGGSWWMRWEALSRTNAEEGPWHYLHGKEAPLPLYLARATEGVFYEFIEEEKVAYFAINSFWGDCPNFRGLINEYLEELETKPDYDVVIDLRYFTGGNYTYATKLASEPPKIMGEDQKIYLITSNLTYSAGIVTAARVKYLAGDRIVTVGEPVGDRMRFWAESLRRTLPHSGMRVYNALQEHDWETDERIFGQTHFNNYKYGVPAGDLVPDQVIGLSFEAYLQNQDPLLEWIFAQE